MVLNVKHIVPATSIGLSTLQNLCKTIDYTNIEAVQSNHAGKSTSTYLDHPAHYFL
jgi:hypothetical protein